jgi:hypothetical protein
MRLGVPAVLPLYRQDRDVPPWTGLRTAGCHLALVRRVFERRPDIRLIAFGRATYRYWLGARTDSEELGYRCPVRAPVVCIDPLFPHS